MSEAIRRTLEEVLRRRRLQRALENAGRDDQVGGGDCDAAAAQSEAEPAGELGVGRAEVQVVEGLEVGGEEAPPRIVITARCSSAPA